MTTITALPTPPQRSDPTNFASRGDAFLAALPDFATEANALAGDVNADAVAAAASAGTATAQAGIATTQAGNAATSAGTAITQAGIATTQAGIATTKAGEAAASQAAINAIFSGGNLNLGSGALTAGSGTFNKTIAGGAMGESFQEELVNPNITAGDYTGTVFRWIAGNNNTDQAFAGTIVTSGAGNGKSDYVIGVKDSTAIGRPVERLRVSSTGLSVTGSLNVTNGSSPNVGGLNIGYGGASENYYSANTHYFRDGAYNVKATLDASGNLLVGTSSQYSSIGHIVTNTSSSIYGIVICDTNTTTGMMSFQNSAAAQCGSIILNAGTSVTYNTTSDYRLKVNPRPADAKRFKDIQFKDFEWIDGRHDCGVIAHELQEVYPDLVIGEKGAVDEDGNPVYQQVNYTGLICRMGAVIQQLTARLEALEAKCATL